MDKKAILNKVKQLYSENQNMMLYLNNNTHKNSVEDIMISYDFQAGEIAEDFIEKGISYQRTMNKIDELLSVFTRLGIDFGQTILEAGVGDGTFLTHLVEKCNIKEGYGFDISFSRLLAGRQYSNYIEGGVVFACFRAIYLIFPWQIVRWTLFIQLKQFNSIQIVKKK